MAKVVIDVKDSKADKEKSTVTIKVQGIDKATETGMVYNKVCEVLKSLN